ncbi:MAG: condensation domain-containing protein, partial [Burkholderiales bacterium]
MKIKCADANPRLAITRADRSGPAPASFAQGRLWFLDQLEPNGSVYNLPAAVEIKGSLNVGALAAGLGEIVRRHEALRTSFASVDNEPVQVIHA